MATTDPNEVHAWLRVCQDEETLRSCIDLCEKQVAKLQTPPDDVKKAVPGLGEYVHETVHGFGGPAQVPMTGPCPGNGLGTTTAEQAAINQSLMNQQAEQGRVPQQQVMGVTLEGSGGAPTHSEALVTKAAGEGKDPLTAAADARRGQGGNMGALPSTEEGAGAPAGSDGGDSGGKHGRAATPSEKGGGHTPGTDKAGGMKEGKASEGTDKAANPGHGKGHGHK